MRFQYKFEPMAIVGGNHSSFLVFPLTDVLGIYLN